ncbi:MAG: hypothetical protein EOO15_01025 [Chitinophagaceae bacterium]|nr:MAG: hypothetical protein EOO15_01025 [Chitinophagaceae bacterium]
MERRNNLSGMPQQASNFYRRSIGRKGRIALQVLLATVLILMAARLNVIKAQPADHCAHLLPLR